jgi:hypothetical protein
MLDLFEFLTVFNLLVILICVIGLYWSINLVIDYYAPTSTGFVNMYFLYYIFFITTLLIAVCCNNYIEMNSINIVAPEKIYYDQNEGIQLQPVKSDTSIDKSNSIIPAAAVIPA